MPADVVRVWLLKTFLCIRWCRSSVLRRDAVSPGVSDTSSEAVAAVPRSRAGGVRQAGVVRGARLSLFSVQQVRRQRRSVRRRRCSDSRGASDLEPASQLVVGGQSARSSVCVVFAVTYVAWFCVTQWWANYFRRPMRSSLRLTYILVSLCHFVPFPAFLNSDIYFLINIDRIMCLTRL